MNLAAKASERGYAMAALLVGMAIMAIMLSAAMPTWSHMIRREKEEELVFRGNQYARAINQYQRKFANANPQTIDVLIEQKLLRKKFRDPLSPNKDGEFQMLYVSTEGAPMRGGGLPGLGPGAGGGGTAGRAGAGASEAASGYSTKPSGGIAGVTSKNTGQSIRTYKGKNRYNEWQFIGMEQSSQAGPGAGPAGGPNRGGRGGREGAGREGGPGGPNNRGGGGTFPGRESGRGQGSGGFPGGGSRGPGR